ncbi:hypothetical protein IA57_04225 [Mangrovimonas yunxiaonensis]|uniref:YD repeat-containing protein n=1 Tax=Mangrovimonas yunxiaonensis TaxID=1197477 RepID=A0A084TK18_9FLAO|nr:hypothetical protein [Mangrovimonas yunxiaonensis]KFB01054.1 hypothetical protein IA57_04225 [Mangrovimonas yunxiaonensis]GGH48318.1 hypothetical protein GCM10011364_23800 [Mangrovimonas yunxiaonensis]
MKNFLASIIILLIFNNSFAQNSESELLKNYKFYVEKNIEMGKWSTKFHLKNGLVSVQENYWKNELRSRTEFEYDRFGNVERETNTFDINEGQINDISNLKLEYNDSLLVRKKFDFGMTEKYSDFNELGKPKLIERIEESDFKAWPFKELMEYDKKGNIIKSTQFSTYEDSNGKIVKEKATTHYKYDNQNNVIEIHREYEPKQEFPIIMIGGPAKYEFEYFRYKYNKKGLWTKKYKTVNGKEYLVAKRKYK